MPAQPIALCRGMRGGGSVVFDRVRGSGSEARRPRRRGRLSPACGRLSRHHDTGADVAIVSKLHPTRSHSGAAEGGINAALGNAADDNPEKHAFDTVKGSDYLGDQDAIEIFTAEAPGDIYQLEHWGCVFSRAPDGKFAQRPFGAAGSPRTVFSADITGHVLIHVCYEQVMKRDIPTYEEYFAWQLVLEGDRCQGVICWDLLNGGVKAIGAKTVILATGGVGPALPGHDQRLRLYG